MRTESMHLCLFTVLVKIALAGCIEPNPAYLAPDPTELPDGYQAGSEDGGPQGDCCGEDDSWPRQEDSTHSENESVVVSEFMANPSAVPDSDGEWLELFNPGQQPVDINGWTLRDKDNDKHVIAAGGPLWVPARGYIVLGRSLRKLGNGGLEVAYAYKQFYLANSADEIILINKAGEVVDTVSYSEASGFIIPEGASLSAKLPGGDREMPSGWCAEIAPWPGSKGDAGTPGTGPGC